MLFQSWQESYILYQHVNINIFASFQLDARKRNPTDGRIIKKQKVLKNQASTSIAAIYFPILSMVLWLFYVSFQLTKNQQGVLRDTTAMTWRVLTPDKGAGYKVNKQPPIKVDKHNDKYFDFVTSMQLTLVISIAVSLLCSLISDDLTIR